MNYLKILLLLIFPLAVCAQETETFNLKRCLEIGLERNFDIRIVRNEQQIADNNATKGNAGYLPTADLSAGYSGSLNDINQHFTDGSNAKFKDVNNQALNAGISINWTAFDGFQIQAKYDRLKELQRMGELGTRLSIEDFIAGFSAEYYNYVRQKIRLENLRYAVELSKERLRIIGARYDIGSMSRLDFQQARVDFNADSSNLIKQYEVVYVSRTRLNQLMALEDVSQNIVLKDSLIEFNPLLNEAEMWENMLNSNSSLLLSAKEKRISELDYRAIKGRDYPYLRLNAGYGYTQNMYGMGQTDKQQILGLNYGLTAGFNIFDGFNRKREQKNARLLIQNRELQYEQLQLGLKADLSNIWMAYENNMGLTSLEKENLQTAKINYSIAIARYKLGDLSGIELREAQNSLLEAEERLLQAQYNTKLCEISLLQISGQIVSYLE
ncbi:MAG: TolC family protein [Dysgonamonadaceae bacterium]|jgi:outer membrane protein TolC|nr:TolC family protein [Dysgonamonadaceae bacterium]